MTTRVQYPTMRPARPLLRPAPEPMPFELRPPHAAVEPAAPTRLDSRDLFGPAAREVEIQHGDGVYRLRRTSLGKLILTK